MTETYDVANISQFNGTIPIIGQLETEIINSNIANTLSYITITGNIVDIVFDATINLTEKATLNGLIVAHTPANIINYTPIGTIIPRIASYNSTSYIRVGTFEYPGTSSSEPITKISAVSYMDSGTTNYTIRVYDMSNSLEIACDTFTNTVESATSLTTISNLPTSTAIFEIQVKKTGGNGTKKVYIDSVTFYT